jgi:hypothetical protein
MHEQNASVATDVEQRTDPSNRGGTVDTTQAETESASDAPEESEPQTLPLDQTFEILKNQRRRYVLQYLDESDGAVSLGELAEQIAAWENGKDVQQITSSERKRVYVGLYQCHLPKMAGMGVLSFNKPRGVIERGEDADWFEPYLHRNESPTGRFEAGVAVLGISVLPVAVLSQTAGVVPLVAMVLVVAALTFGTAYRLTREDHDADAGGLTAT